MLFADDSTILFCLKDPEVIAEKLGKILNLVLHGWCIINCHYILEKLNLFCLTLNENLGRLNVFKFPVMESLLILLIMLNISA